MRKTFSLQDPKHKPERVVASIKAELRKYLKREHRKSVPEGLDFWDFDCRYGPDEEKAEVVHVSKVVEKIDEGAEAGWSEVYVEILARAAKRRPKATKQAEGSEE